MTKHSPLNLSNQR